MGTTDGPHNREAEEQVLGCLLIQNEVYDRVVGLLRPEHFFFEAHRIIYAAIGAKIAAGELANPITLKPNFDQHPALSTHGEFNYLATLAANAASVQDAEAYAAAVVDCANRRQLIETADIIRAMAVSGTAADGSTDILSAAQSIMGGIDPGATKDRMLSLPEFAARAIDQTVAAQDGRVVGHRTGMRDLDSILGGMGPGRLYILGGRPGMGKSGIALNIAVSVARSGLLVGFFSHEMTGEEIGHRALASSTGIAYTDMQRAGLNAYDLGRIVDAKDGLPPTLHVRDSGAKTLPMIRRDCRRLMRRGKLGLIVVDYLQLIEATMRLRGKREEEVAEVSRGLKALARELHVPVLALSALNRTVESQQDKRPGMASLRESGAVESDADAVIFVYREEYYLRQGEPQDPGEHAAWEERLHQARNVAELIVAKNRHGPTRTANVFFDPATNRTGDLAQDGHG